MATISHVASTVFGNKRVVIVRCTSAGNERIDTGLERLDHIHPMIVSATSLGNPHFKLNAFSGGTAAPGQFELSGLASGDVVQLVYVGN